MDAYELGRFGADVAKLEVASAGPDWGRLIFCWLRVRSILGLRLLRKELSMADSVIPASHLDLFKKKAFANLVTLMPGGEPQVTPVWID